MRAQAGVKCALVGSATQLPLRGHCRMRVLFQKCGVLLVVGMRNEALALLTSRLQEEVLGLVRG